jgi:hypothetical protein
VKPETRLHRRPDSGQTPSGISHPITRAAATGQGAPPAPPTRGRAAHSASTWLRVLPQSCRPKLCPPLCDLGHIFQSANQPSVGAPYLYGVFSLNLAPVANDGSPLPGPHRAAFPRGHAWTVVSTHMRSAIWIWIFVGSTIGGLIPALWGGDMLSWSGVLLSGVGAIMGLWLASRASS